MYDVKKIKCLAFLWCQGNNKQQKSLELFDLLTDSNQTKIFNPELGMLSNDKEAKETLLFLFDISGEIMVTQEKKYTGSESIGATIEQVEEIKKKNHEKLL